MLMKVMKPLPLPVQMAKIMIKMVKSITLMIAAVLLQAVLRKVPFVMYLPRYIALVKLVER